MRILVLNGPNLNLLGIREPELYGKMTLSALETTVRKHGQSLGVDIDCYQSNQEGDLIDALHKAGNIVQAVVFNPGGYTHTSVALHDAISAIGIPVIEVHLTNIHGREEFRSRSLTARACRGQICGLGVMSYEMAITVLAREQGAEKPQAAAEARKESSQDSRQEDRDDREKRRRRGRRGGRGRHRDQDDQGSDRASDAPKGSAQSSTPRETTTDPSKRYADLKGVSLRRGLDVLAEEDKAEPVAAEVGVVNFLDTPQEQKGRDEGQGGEKDFVLRVEPEPTQESSRRRRGGGAKSRRAEKPKEAEKTPVAVQEPSASAEGKAVKEETKPAQKSTRRKAATPRKKSAAPRKTSAATKKKTTARKATPKPIRTKE